MTVKRYKTLYLPALIIVATVLILLLVIGVSTYRNMNREKERMEETLHREGRLIVHALNAAVRTAYPSGTPTEKGLNNLLKDMARNTEITSLVIIDRSGNLVARSAAEERRRIGGASLDILLQEKGVVTRYDRDTSGERVFELIQPLSSVNPLPGAGGEEKGGQGETGRWSRDKIAVIDFRLRAFEAARQEDIRHIVLMGAILIVLGTGTLYFVVIVQNYYLVDRTLVHIRTYMENVVDSMADGLISLDNEGRVVTMNRQAAEIMAVKPEAVKGRAIAEILSGDGKYIFEENKDAIIRDLFMEMTRHDGTVMPLSLSSAPLKDETGGEMGSVLLIRDMREIRDLQEKVRRSERLASLGRLAAGMAHEIRNPLSSIRGFAQFFLNRFKGQKTEEEYAAIMISEVDRLNRVITGLLDFARPKEPRREVCSPEGIMDYSLKLLSVELEKKKVTVQRNYSEDLPDLKADREQISQAFLNLLLNAMESAGEGGEISIGLQGNADKSRLEISVADTGAGIPAAELEKIFEPFFSTKKKGTGLGLAIVHQVVERHGGEITAANRPEGGAIFKITLPAGR